MNVKIRAFVFKSFFTVEPKTAKRYLDIFPLSIIIRYDCIRFATKSMNNSKQVGSVGGGRRVLCSLAMRFNSQCNENSYERVRKSKQKLLRKVSK